MIIAGLITVWAATPLKGARRTRKKRRSTAGYARSGSRASSGGVYPNCAAARAAGAAPLRRGDDGYSRRLDRDGDGVACE
ncbi:excalibur calcium-binding domain-containing protein [Sphingobium sp.]|uniref:excalibur calcium-binding domain-containing protein n=1 Tax=Sphingobium sp. TaxID=1912891 RepID=UPI002E2451F6